MGIIPQETLEDLKNESSGDFKFYRIKEILGKKIRILKAPVVGIEYWTDGKPKRVPLGTEIKDQIDVNKFGNPSESKWWGLAIYCHEENMVGVLGVTQKTIRDSIAALDTDPDWGDVTAYDIKIAQNDDGKGYTLTPLPSKPLSDEAQEVVDSVEIDLDRLIKEPTEGEDVTVQKSPSTGVAQAAVDPDDLPF